MNLIYYLLSEFKELEGLDLENVSQNIVDLTNLVEQVYTAVDIAHDHLINKYPESAGQYEIENIEDLLAENLQQALEIINRRTLELKEVLNNDWEIFGYYHYHR